MMYHSQTCFLIQEINLTYMYMYSEFFYYFNSVRTFVETSAIDNLSVYVKWVYVFF